MSLCPSQENLSTFNTPAKHYPAPLSSYDSTVPRRGEYHPQPVVARQPSSHQLATTCLRQPVFPEENPHCSIFFPCESYHCRLLVVIGVNAIWINIKRPRGREKWKPRWSGRARIDWKRISAAGTGLRNAALAEAIAPGQRVFRV